MKASWNSGDRVRVLRGAHAGRTGTISMLPSDPLASYMEIADGQVLVALDGEPGGLTGGRGGSPVIVADDDIERYDEAPGREIGHRDPL
jgi:hypothetical protein